MPISDSSTCRNTRCFIYDTARAPVVCLYQTVVPVVIHVICFVYDTARAPIGYQIFVGLLLKETRYIFLMQNSTDREARSRPLIFHKYNIRIKGSELDFQFIAISIFRLSLYFYHGCQGNANSAVSN